MTTFLPPRPTLRSIFLGLLLAAVVLLAILHLDILIKSIGAAFMFLPDQIGTIEMVYPGNVHSVDFSDSPTHIDFSNPGYYLLYTNNYDLLVIHDSILESGGDPWLEVVTSESKAATVEIINRGLILFDTPFAEGRPVLRVYIPSPGRYYLIHPTRSVSVYFVPDYLTGKVGLLNLLLFIQLTVFGFPLYRYGIRKYVDKRNMQLARQQSNFERIEAVRKKMSTKKDDLEFDSQDQNIWRPKR